MEKKVSLELGSSRTCIAHMLSILISAKYLIDILFEYFMDKLLKCGYGLYYPNGF